MKKLAAITILGSALFISSSASANYYAGGELQANTYSAVLTQASGGVFAGARINENLGGELGYSYHPHITTTLFGNKFSVASHNVYADLMGYLPIDPSFDVIGSVGAGLFTTSASLKNYGSGSVSMAGVRVGVGAQYHFNENFGARFLLGYQSVYHPIHMVSARLGVFFKF